MKKVGIITLCGNNNFGNKLQNYAIIQTLDKLNCNPETIWIENSCLGSRIKLIRRSLIKKFDDYFKNYRRTKHFIEFNKYLKITNHLVFNEDFRKVKNKYDIFLVGSDQVWNYNYFNNDSFYFLTESIKRNIAFSASFGVSNIPKEYQDRYKKGLNNFDYISVREYSGKEIVEELTNRKDAEVLIDPTMLLTNDEWDRISQKPKKLKSKKYILNYFLGNLSDERKNEIERIARENDCEIINILNPKEPLYNVGPSEFLYLEKNAFLICTDSFHSAVFAILYNRTFIVFEREQANATNMNTRIETLINKFQLKNREFTGKITEDNLKHDYTEAYKILEKEREKSLKFLKKSLDVEE